MDKKNYTIKEIAEEINKEEISPELTGLAEDIKRSREGKAGDEVMCRLCGGIYKQPVWHFYGLCDGCYDEFKWQQYGAYRYTDGVTRLYGSSEWIKYKQSQTNTKLLDIMGHAQYIPISCNCTHHIKEENK